MTERIQCCDCSYFKGYIHIGWFCMYDKDSPVKIENMNNTCERFNPFGTTDCSRCIYMGNIAIRHIGELEIKEEDGCKLHLRTTRPICPMFDDGKEVKQ